VTKLFHPLLALIASASDSQLRRQVRYLKEENQVLRARIPGQVHTRPEERQRLLKFGLPLGPAIGELISIVTTGTFCRWRREAKRSKPAGRKSHGKSQALRELVLKIARETGFGYTKILGELRSLGISRICRQTVKNILKEERIEPSPQRRPGTWEDYLKAVRSKNSAEPKKLRNQGNNRSTASQLRPSHQPGTIAKFRLTETQVFRQYLSLRPT
jgi:putative transposase